VRAALNSADFYDLFGPPRRGARLLRARRHKRSLVYDSPGLELDVSGAIAGNLDRLPLYQNVPSTSTGLHLNANSRSVHSALAGVRETRKGTAGAGLLGQVVTASPAQVYGTYDLGVALPLGHSSIWMRTPRLLAARSHGAFANFYFGGFGNNYVDQR